MPGREHPAFLKPAWLGLPGSGVLLFDQVFRFKDKRAGVVDVHPWAVDARGGLQDAGPLDDEVVGIVPYDAYRRRIVGARWLGDHADAQIVYPVHGIGATGACAEAKP